MDIVYNNGFPTMEDVEWCKTHNQLVIEISCSRNEGTHTPGGELTLRTHARADRLTAEALERIKSYMLQDISPGVLGAPVAWCWASWKAWQPS